MMDMLTVNSTLVMQNNGVLEYNSAFGKPAPLVKNAFPDFLDDFSLVPADGQPILGDPTQTINLAINFSDFSVGAR